MVKNFNVEKIYLNEYQLFTSTNPFPCSFWQHKEITFNIHLTCYLPSRLKIYYANVCGDVCTRHVIKHVFKISFSRFFGYLVKTSL